MTNNNQNNSGIKDFSGNPSPLSSATPQSAQLVGSTEQVVAPTTPSNNEPENTDPSMDTNTTENLSSQDALPQNPGMNVSAPESMQAATTPSTQPQISGVEPAPQANQLPQIPIESTKKPFNILKVAFMFLILVALVVGGYFGYQYFMSQRQSAVTEEPQTTSESQEVVPTDVMKGESMMEESTSTPSSTVTLAANQKMVDFSSCSPGDGYSSSVPSGSTYLSVTDVNSQEKTCQVEALNEVEGGYIRYSCNVPASVGSIVFTLSDTGSDFSDILSYCAETKTENTVEE